MIREADNPFCPPLKKARSEGKNKHPHEPQCELLEFVLVTISCTQKTSFLPTRLRSPCRTWRTCRPMGPSGGSQPRTGVSPRAAGEGFLEAVL
jgi:hypothetical protein